MHSFKIFFEIPVSQLSAAPTHSLKNVWYWMPLWFLTNAIRNWNTFGIELRNRNFLDVFSFRLCTSSLQPALILLCLGRRYRSPSCGDLQYDAAAVPAGVTVQITHIFWQSWYLIMSLDFTWCSESLFSCTTIFFILLLFRVFWNNRQSVCAIQSQDLVAAHEGGVVVQSLRGSYR